VKLRKLRRVKLMSKLQRGEPEKGNKKYKDSIPIEDSINEVTEERTRKKGITVESSQFRCA